MRCLRATVRKPRHYRDRLEALTVKVDGRRLLPELYYVPRECVDAEKANPGSQIRVPNENIPLGVGNRVFYYGQLLKRGWLSPQDLDLLAFAIAAQAPMATDKLVVFGK